jgi:CBS domain containing-hemolysin-like protein
MRYKFKYQTPLALFFLLAPFFAFAESHESGFEDSVAEVVSWIALIVAPIALISVFLFVHVLPEKIAEKRNHPQAEAIKILCILSLFFGGLLWPLAWLWAYSKPVLYKMAYGTDRGDYHETTLKEFKENKEADATEEHNKKSDSETN